MTRLFLLLLALLFSMSGPVMGGYSYFGQSSNAARGAPTSPKPFAMGIDDHLDDFARQHGAATWKHFVDPVHWKPEIMARLSDPNQGVIFNLDNVDVWGGVQRGASGRGGATDWELFQLRQNPSFPNVEFWKGGQQVKNPFQ